MTELAKRILTVFAESYPTSASFKGGRRLRRSGWHEIFPRIRTDVSAKNDFLEAVEELVEAGILSARWKRFRVGDELEALYLENPQSLFDALGVPSPESVARDMLEMLGTSAWKDVKLRGIADYLVPRLEAGHPVPVRNAAELAGLGKLFSLSPEEAAACPVRALSVRLYADSKRLERVMAIADRLARAMGVQPISAALGLGRSYPEVSCVISGRLIFVGGNGPWDCDGEIITLPLATVSRVGGVELHSAAVLSIENKETFHVLAGRLTTMSHALPPGTAGVVYTAGHPNDAVKAFLRLCVSAGARLYHYGDMDPDGILIAQEIAAMQAVPVVPWNMSVDLHRRYVRYGYTLDRTQLARLALVADSAPRELRELAQEIARTGVGVEQEIIDLGIR